MNKKIFMSETEAKGRYCPVGIGSSNVRCVASECMAWRWENWSASIKELDNVERWESSRGYCGLGGSVNPDRDIAN